MLCAKCKYDVSVIINKCVRVKDLKSNRWEIFFMNSTKAVTQRCSAKKVFLEILQNSWASTCNFIKKEALAQVFCCEFWEIF